MAPGAHDGSGERATQLGRTPSTPSTACWAPTSALYLQPDGAVAACCTSTFRYGSVAPGPRRQTLRQVWEGVHRGRHVARLAEGMLDLGCVECGDVAASAGRQASLAAEFDAFTADGEVPYPRVLDLALSSRCNLQCVMCNGSLSSSIRTKREGRPPLSPAYDDAFFAELDEFLPHVERFHFKGGEPFLSVEARRVWDRLIELDLHPEVNVTTNGTVFNERVEHYVRALRMHPVVSVDAVTPSVLESIRVGVDGARLWRTIDRYQALVADTGARMSLCFCLMVENWRELGPFLREVDRRGVGCIVIIVTHPVTHDLLRLPADELGAVYRRLLDTAPDLRTPAAIEAWASALRRIDAALGTAVPLPTPSRGPIPIKLFRRRRSAPATTPPSPPAPPEVDADAEAELRATVPPLVGVDPIVIDAVDGVVEDVSTPPWADWVDTSRWPGTEMRSLLDTVRRSVGPADDFPHPPAAPGVHVVEVEVDTAEGCRRLMVYLFTRPGGAERALVVPHGSTGADMGPAPAVVADDRPPPVIDETFPVEDVARYYDEWNERYEAVFGDVYQHLKAADHEQLLDHMVEVAGMADGMRLVDAGCGIAGPARHFARARDVHVDAVTISPVQVARATELVAEAGLSDRITVHLGDFHRLEEVVEGGADVVYFLEALVHSHDPLAALRSAHAVLKPGGVVYIKDFYRGRSDDPAEQRVIDECVEATNRICHLTIRNTEDVLGWVEEAGFTVEVSQALAVPAYSIEDGHEFCRRYDLDVAAGRDFTTTFYLDNLEIRGRRLG